MLVLCELFVISAPLQQICPCSSVVSAKVLCALQHDTNQEPVQSSFWVSPLSTKATLYFVIVLYMLHAVASSLYSPAVRTMSIIPYATFWHFLWGVLHRLVIIGNGIVGQAGPGFFYGGSKKGRAWRFLEQMGRARPKNLGSCRGLGGTICLLVSIFHDCPWLMVGRYRRTRCQKAGRWGTPVMAFVTSSITTPAQRHSRIHAAALLKGELRDNRCMNAWMSEWSMYIPRICLPQSPAIRSIQEQLG